MEINKTSSRKVMKPWGYELIWAETNNYVGKILHIKSGEALSLQYHIEKEETIMVLKGRIKMEYALPEEDLCAVELGPYDTFHIKPGMRHRMTAIEDTDIAEVSTPQLGDVVRIEDRYGRC